MDKLPRILIVDDEKGIRSLLTLAFLRAGYEVRTAADANEARALCASEPLDVMLSDVLMPCMNGHELVRWVAAHHPQIRCALMTAFDDVDCDRCPYMSGCEVLPKPFAPRDAVALVAKLLAQPTA
jgi:DNA-binding NtrC family response regulator